MSKKICHREQYKLNQILEQVKALSDVVDELRMALNDLKKASLNVNHETVCFKSTKENNEVNDDKPTVLRNMKTYFKNTGICTRIDKTHRVTNNVQAWKPCSTSNYVFHCDKKRDYKPSAHTIRPLTIYGSLKVFKNKIIKNVQNIRKTRRFPKSADDKHECVTSSQQQLRMCVLQKEEEQKCVKGTKDEDTTDVSEKLDNLTDTSLTSDAQTGIAICSWQENNDKLPNLPCQSIIENNTQTSPLSVINDDGCMTRSNRFTSELSKNCTKQTFLTNKIKKYKKCSCKEHCPYTLYRLPCNKHRCSTPEKKVDDADEVNGLRLECLSIRRKNNFPTFINVDAAQEKNDRRFTGLSPIKIGVDKSSTSSLSLDLDVKVCNDHRNSLENIDEFSKRRRARTYVVNKNRKNYLIKNLKNKNELSFNIISLWRDVNKKKKKIDEIIQNILSQGKYIDSEEEDEGYQKYIREDFIDADHWSLKNKNKQCIIPTSTIPILKKKISVKTSNSKFQENSLDHQSYQRTSKTRYPRFPKTITPRWMRTHTQKQSDKYSYFNYLENKLSFLNDYANVKNISKIDKNEEKKITRKNDACIIKMDVSASQIIWPRVKKPRNIYSAFRFKEDVNARSKKSVSQICDQTDEWRDWKTIKASCPFCYNHITTEKHKKIISNLTNYSHFPSNKTLNFDMSNVSGRLYDCLEKLEDITA